MPSLRCSNADGDVADRAAASAGKRVSVPPTEPLAGTIDLVGPAADRTEALTTALRDAFRQYGYEPVTPPILERAGPFLDRSGEDIRDRMYIFSDPSGREVCLRPELTIPIARLYANKCKGENQLLRASYIGSAFRYDKPRVGRYRQFTQVGAEFIGETDRCLADAETLALADHALRSCGLDHLQIAVSDIELFTSVFDDERLSSTWRRRLRKVASDPKALRSLLDGASEAETAAPAATLDLQRALASVAESDRNEVLRSLLKSFSIDSGFGSRDIDDIVQRTLEKTATSGHGGLPEDLVAGLVALLGVDGPIAEGLEAVRAVAATHGFTGLPRLVELWERRLELLDALGVDAAALRLDLSLRRGIAYYSGFVFQIQVAGSSTDQVCAGGRYDELVETLGGRSGTPAVGFALGLERVLLALEQSEAPTATSPLDALVVGGGDVAEVQVLRITAALRAAGITAVFLNGRRVRYALGHAVKRGVRYVAVVGEREAASGVIVLRDLDAHEQVTVTVEEAARLIGERESVR